MGIEYFCDGCGKKVPLQNSLTMVNIGEQEICALCYQCSSQLKTGLQQQKMDAEKQRIAVSESAVQDPQPPQQATEPEFRPPQGEPNVVTENDEEPVDLQLRDLPPDKDLTQ